MDCWFFDENLSQQEILERAEKEFDIKASRQTLTAYFRYRERIQNMPDGIEQLEPEEQEAVATRVGAGMRWKTLETRTLNYAAMAAFEMSLAEPGQMRVKEIQSLMKMINERQQLWMDQRTRAQKVELQKLALLTKIQKDQSGKHTKEEFETMMMEAADIWDRTKQRRAENQARREAEKTKREFGNHDGGPAEAQTGTEVEAQNDGKGAKAAEIQAAEGQPNPETETKVNEEGLGKDI